MSNQITEKYFTHSDFSDRARQALRKITAETGFQPEKEIFRGKIYDKNKVGSIILKGIYQNQPAVLKIQGLKPEIDEIIIIEAFNKQNKSEIVRLPRIYQHKNWHETDGFGYLLMEFIEAGRVYNPPFADERQISDFCRLYQEYKTKCFAIPPFEQNPHEKNSLLYTSQRVAHWVNIAEAKSGKENRKSLNDKMKLVESFLSLAGRHLPAIKMQFMHGHFSSDDLYKISDDEYVLMSNLFWSYRPEFYDAAFHLWAGIKSIRDYNVTFEQVKNYLQAWIDSYKYLPVIQADPDFEKKFNIMMAERCIGALLIDIQNQYYARGRDKYEAHLVNLFSDLFKYSAEQLKQGG